MSKALQSPHAGLRKDIEETFVAFQANLKLAAAVLNHSRDPNEDRETLEQTITNHLISLKTRVNTLVPINRLPVEIFTYIIRYAYSPPRQNKHPYILYTWVCHQWRSVLVETAELWMFIRHGTHLATQPFDHELLRRSKSAQLNVRAKVCSGPFNSAFEIFLAKESNRIKNLWVISDEEESDYLHRTIFSEKRFLSLRGFVHDNPRGWETHTLIHLLPTLSTSDHLETFQCALATPAFSAVRDQLAPIFGYIRNLNIRIYSYTILQALLNMLHNNSELQYLQIEIQNRDRSIANLTRDTSLPGLQFLSINNALIMERLRIPRLSSLTVLSNSLAAFNFVQPALKAFDLSSIRYLYILECHHSQNISESHSILGSKERRHTSFEHLFSTNTEYFDYPVLSAPDSYPIEDFYSARDVLSVEDILLDIRPRDCFELKFTEEDFNEALRRSLPSILPRLANLTEVYVFSRALQCPNGLTLESFLTQLPPFVDRIIITDGDLLDLIRLLSNISICPRLKQLHFKGSKVYNLEEVDYAEKIGKMVTECIRLRHKACINQLQYIALGNCPPLSWHWLEESRKMGTKVVTDKPVK